MFKFVQLWPHCTGTPNPMPRIQGPPGSHIYWPRLETCSTLFTWRSPGADIWWQLKYIHTIGKRAVCILLECFLLFCVIDTVSSRDNENLLLLYINLRSFVTSASISTIKCAAHKRTLWSEVTWSDLSEKNPYFYLDEVYSKMCTLSFKISNGIQNHW